MMTFVNISFNFSISPSRRFFSSNFVKDIRFAWGMVISFDERTRKKFSREADAEISQQYNFHPIELVSIRRICTVSSVHILSIRRWNVCMCVHTRFPKTSIPRNSIVLLNLRSRVNTGWKLAAKVGGRLKRRRWIEFEPRANFQLPISLTPLGPLYNFPLTYDRIDTAGRGSSIDKSGGPCATTLSFSVLNDVVTFPDALLNRVLRIFHERNWKWRYRPSQL